MGERLVAAMTAAIVMSEDCVEGAVVSSFGIGLVEDIVGRLDWDDYIAVKGGSDDRGAVVWNGIKKQ